MDDLVDECLRIAQNLLGFNSLVPRAEQEVAEMRYLLRFALINQENFMDDRFADDGVKAEWFRRVKQVLPKDE